MHTVPTPEPSRMIDAYLRHLEIDRDRAEATLETYHDILTRMQAELPAGLIGAHTDELRAWIYVAGRKPATRKQYRSVATGFFDWACNPADPASPVLDHDPARLLPRVKVPRGRARPIQTEQLADILARAAAPYDLWYLAAAAAGLRAVEISHLDREHVTAESTWVQGKGGKERLVPTHPALWAMIEPLPWGPIARRPDGVTRAERRYLYHSANYHLHHVLGYQAITMHRLRHWFGTHAHRASGGDLAVAQELLGHASPVTTRIYVEVDAVAMAAAVNALPLPVV